MDRPALTIITDDATSSASTRWHEGLSRAWSAANDGAPCPSIKAAPLTDLFAGTLEPTADDLCLVVLGADTSHALIVRLDGLFARTRTPCVVLIPDSGAAALDARPIDAPCLLIEPDSIAPDRLALILATLARRQPAMAELAQELSLVRTASGGMAKAMDSFRDEMQLAASVQRDFLPKTLPTLDGLDTALMFRPAGFVSGDVYDLAPVGNGLLSFFLADAIGHGVPAALLTIVLCQGLVRTERTDGFERVLKPDESLTRLNTVLCEKQFESARFATAVYGLIDPATGLVTLAGAGHPPPLVISKTGVRQIKTAGPLLGIFAEAQFDCARFVLEPGETLLLYSDGFEIALPGPDGTPGGPEHMDRIARIVRSTLEQDRDLAHAMGLIERAVDEQPGSLHQRDDLTILAIGRVANTARTISETEHHNLRTV